MRGPKLKLALSSTWGYSRSQEESQCGEEDEEGDFEPYDPVIWERATEANTVDEDRDAEQSLAQHSQHTDDVPSAPASSPTSDTFLSVKKIKNEHEQKLQLESTQKADFVRALKDSRMNTKPFFRKGDILRVVDKKHRGTLDGEWDRIEVEWQKLNFYE